MNWTQGRVIAVVAIMLTATACVTQEDAEPIEPTGGTEAATTAGMALTMDILADTDVAGMRYEIDRVACPGGDGDFEPWSADAEVDLEDLLLPGGLDAFEDQPLDGESAHLFADYFTMTPAGCYDVTVTPLDEDGEPSDDCATASAEGVEVEDGETTEILLVSQCDGPERGALDTVAVVNHPPTLDAVTYNPSKFTTCGDTVEICATATDPDGDPIEFDWDFPEGLTVEAGPIGSDGETTTQCASVIAESGDSYNIDLTVYDLFVEDGELVRAEDWLQARGEDEESHDDLTFPLHVQCDEPICPEGAAAITSYEFTITDGDSTFTTNTLEGSLSEDATIVATFTISDGCSEVPVALGSYADEPDDEGDLDPNRIDVDAGIFGAGTWTLQVGTPSCAFDAAFGLVDDFDGDPSSLPGVDEIDALSSESAGSGFCQ